MIVVFQGLIVAFSLDYFDLALHLDQPLRQFLDFVCLPLKAILVRRDPVLLVPGLEQLYRILVSFDFLVQSLRQHLLVLKGCILLAINLQLLHLWLDCGLQDLVY